LALASPVFRPAGYALQVDVEAPLLLLAILMLGLPRRTLEIGLLAIITSAALIGVVAIIEHFGPRQHLQIWYGAPAPSPDSSFFVGRNYRVGSFIGSPLVLAFYLAVAAPIALGAAFARPRWRVWSLVCFAAIVGGTLVTATRSGYLGAALGTVVVLWSVAGRPAARVAATCLVVLVLVIAFALIRQSNNQTLLRTSETTSKKSQLSRDIALIVQRPLGYGLGTVDAIEQRFNVNAPTTSSESTLLAKGIEGGIVELFLYPLCLFIFAVRLNRIRRRAQAHRQPLAALAAGATGAFVAIAGADLFLGVQELVVEMVLWGAAAIVIALSTDSAVQ
jgi:hypothetical protein